MLSKIDLLFQIWAQNNMKSGQEKRDGNKVLRRRWCSASLAEGWVPTSSTSSSQLPPAPCGFPEVLSQPCHREHLSPPCHCGAQGRGHRVSPRWISCRSASHQGCRHHCGESPPGPAPCFETGRKNSCQSTWNSAHQRSQCAEWNCPCTHLGGESRGWMWHYSSPHACDTKRIQFRRLFEVLSTNFLLFTD